MEQHPVPQHIDSFEFKLFGNLTVKQFIKLSIPMSVATVIFFADPIPTYIRLPLSVIFGAFGFFIALVPIGGRSFEKWVIAFIRAIFAPTQRIWVKEKKIPEFLSNIAKGSVNITPPEPITDSGKQKLLSYLRSLPSENANELDILEKNSLTQLGFEPTKSEGGKLPPSIIWGPSGNEEELPYNFRSSLPQVAAIGQDSEIIEEPRTRIMATPRVSSHAKKFILGGVDRRLASQSILSPKAHLASDTNFTVDNVIPIQNSGDKVKFVHGIGKTRVRKLHFGPPAGFDLSKLPIRGEARFELSNELKNKFQVDESIFNGGEEVVLEEPTVSKQTNNGFSKHRQQVTLNSSAVLSKTQNVSLKPQQEEMVDRELKVFGQKSAESASSVITKAQIIPLTNRPNVLSGLVTDSRGVPVVGAILTVRDERGIPLRAFKTNKLGQFLSATSLENGQYQIEIESEIFNFTPIAIKLNGEILSPFEIKAKHQES